MFGTVCVSREWAPRREFMGRKKIVTWTCEASVHPQRFKNFLLRLFVDDPKQTPVVFGSEAEEAYGNHAQRSLVSTTFIYLSSNIRRNYRLSISPLHFLRLNSKIKHQIRTFVLRGGADMLVCGCGYIYMCVCVLDNIGLFLILTVDSWLMVVEPSGLITHKDDRLVNFWL